jgi:hypothetical protein
MNKNKQCVVLGEKLAVFSNILADFGFRVNEFDDVLDERVFLSILRDQPFAIILPLTLPHYGSLRLAELIAMRKQRIRLILVSGTTASREKLDELFDIFLPGLGRELIDALEQEEWVHAFERRTMTIDSAIQQILKDASCFWANRHAFSWQTLVDYQRAIAAEHRSFTILFLASDPADQARLRLMKEYSEVQNELSRSSRYAFNLKQAFSSRADELARILLETRPHIVHFSGHGDSSGRLCFEKADGHSWPADKSAIAQMFEPCARYVKCVLLNACFSAEQAEMIAAHIEYTAGLSSAVPDDAAIALAKGFYGALAASGKVSLALRTAQTNLRLLAGESVDLICLDRTSPFCGSGAER